MGAQHRDRLRQIEAINMRREIQSQRHAWEMGLKVREALGLREGRKLMRQIHAAELAACKNHEARGRVASLQRTEMDGLEGRTTPQEER